MKTLFSAHEGAKKMSKLRFLCLWLNVWVGVWFSEWTQQTIFWDPVRPAQTQETHLFIQGLWKWLEDRGRCLAGHLLETRWGMWLVQAKIRECIMTKKTPPEAGGIGPDGDHCLSAFATGQLSQGLRWNAASVQQCPFAVPPKPHSSSHSTLFAPPRVQPCSPVHTVVIAEVWVGIWCWDGGLMSQ